ncbi:hypothetical protein FB446DRAFT_263921 [Lentinula raphanica]|nr:hypothetical protein FB446DRAFT_263921 [Lentinula raphanica]
MAISIVRRIPMALLLLASVHRSMGVPLSSMPSDQNIEPRVSSDPHVMNVYYLPHGATDYDQHDMIILGVNPGQGLLYDLESPPELPTTTLSHQPAKVSTAWTVTRHRVLPYSESISSSIIHLGTIRTLSLEVKEDLFGSTRGHTSGPPGMITQPLILEHGIEGEPTVMDFHNANKMMMDRLRNLPRLYFLMKGKVVDISFSEEKNGDGPTNWEFGLLKFHSA